MGQYANNTIVWCYFCHVLCLQKRFLDELGPGELGRIREAGTGNTLAHPCAEKGRLDCLQMLYAHLPQLLRERNKAKLTPAALGIKVTISPAVQRQTAVTAYFSSKQLLLFAFAYVVSLTEIYSLEYALLLAESSCCYQLGICVTWASYAELFIRTGTLGDNIPVTIIHL